MLIWDMKPFNYRVHMLAPQHIRDQITIIYGIAFFTPNYQLLTTI